MRPEFRRDEHIDAPKQRTFSRAGPADDPKYLALAYAQRDVPERGRVRSEALVDIIDNDHRPCPSRLGKAPHIAYFPAPRLLSTGGAYNVINILLQRSR